ncbi:class I SAM-dependent methyltransferase [Paenibacillus sp. GCM10012303]|uniref:class I SAM-dependent methyltransferase n=1 Tax=Paenibacillus sp. GCM10012303 TaxID=3317340 RepID=UPI0036167458
MSPLFNRYYDTIMKPLETKSFHPIRESLLARARGTVLEIGSGTGINFPLYRSPDKVVAIEPDSVMLTRSLQRAEQSAVPVEVVQAGAERLPFEANRFDSVVCTLVLCTIPDPLAALAEIRRVCKPGGTLLLFEHVLLEHPIWNAVQQGLTPAWKKMCGGCHLNRNSLAFVQQAGFQIVHLEWKYKKLFLVAEARNGK